MSQKEEVLDDSDLEDELLVMELTQQITETASPSSSEPMTVTQQRLQLNVILYTTEGIMTL